MRLAGTIAATLSLALPALAQGAGNAPAFKYVAPLTTQGQSMGAKNPAPGEQQTPPPAPDGCPFRDGKLQLLV
jgi:hypothetical protein